MSFPSSNGAEICQNKKKFQFKNLYLLKYRLNQMMLALNYTFWYSEPF